jgi:hypothetical protein
MHFELQFSSDNFVHWGVAGEHVQMFVGGQNYHTIRIMGVYDGRSSPGTYKYRLAVRATNVNTGNPVTGGIFARDLTGFKLIGTTLKANS